MTNEKLAELIQDGQKEYISVLYDNLKYLLKSLTGSFYRQYAAACTRAGVTFEDLNQEAFFGLYNAVTAFDRTKEYLLTAYLKFHLRKQFQKLLGLYTERSKNDPLNHASSIDVPIITEESEIMLSDTIQDETAQLPFDQVSNAIYNAQLRKALNTSLGYIPPRQRTVLEDRYFKGLQFSQIASELEVTPGRAGQIANEALAKLRRGKPLQILKSFAQDIYSYGLKGTGICAFKNNQCSSVERTTERLFSGLINLH